MDHDKLNNLVKIKQLHPGPATSSEIDSLVQRGLKKLHDSKNVDFVTDIVAERVQALTA